MKPCPLCAEQIQDAAIKCRFCGAMLTRQQSSGSVQPSGRDTLARRQGTRVPTQGETTGPVAAGGSLAGKTLSFIQTASLGLLAGLLIVLVFVGLLQVPYLFIPYFVAASCVAWLWQKKGRRAWTAFLYSFAFSPLVTFAVWLFMEPDRSALEMRALAEGMKKCPACAELVKAEAVVCKYCRADLRSTA